MLPHTAFPRLLVEIMTMSSTSNVPARGWPSFPCLLPYIQSIPYPQLSHIIFLRLRGALKASFGGIYFGVEETMDSAANRNGSTGSKNDEEYHERTIELTAIKCAHLLKQMGDDKNATP
jgi:hypothetical protein